jgi:putative ABC transport system permease protein
MFRRKRTAIDFSTEIEAHIQSESERLREQGLSEDEARDAARRAFGNVMRAEERFYESGRWLWWDHFWQDLRFGLRMLVRNPGFAAVAVLTLALGVAINATMFSMVSAFLLRRPPVRDPDRVLVVSAVNPARGFRPDTNPISAPNYLAWREANGVFLDAAAADPYRTISLTAEKQPEAVSSAAVSPNYFRVLGVSPLIGRTFADGEDQAGHDHVVILSQGLWERRFGGDPAILRRSIRLNRENYDVVGVMPTDFHLLGYTAQLWTPLVFSPADRTAAGRGKRWLYMFARLHPGATLEQARAAVVAMARRAQDEFPESEKGWSATVRTLPDFLVYDFGVTSALWVLMTTVGFVLMIACANVAGLLLARAAGRRKELAIRMSLGAGRLRIVRQLLTEGLVLALLGGGAGLMLAYWGIHVLQANLKFNPAISAVEFRLDWNVLLFVLSVSLLCALLCGVAPGLNAARTDVNTSLKNESRAASSGRSQNRLRTGLVTGEIALAICLLVGTGLLIRAILLIEHQNLGFQADSLLTADVNLDDAQYKGDAKQIAFAQEVIRRLEQLPGAEGVAVTSDLPATGAPGVTLRIEGQPELPANERPRTLHVVVSPDYFRAAVIPLLRGRVFTETDNVTAPRVVVVNQEFVRRHLHEQEALGTQIALKDSAGGASPEWSEIVGVVGNVKSYSEDARDDPEVYEAFFQRPVASPSIMMRTRSDPNGLAQDLRNAVAQVDPDLPLSRLETMHALIERQKGGDAFFTQLLATFALLALVLAAIGIYGLVAHSVGQRTHEIGIRMAVGAGRMDVLRMILWQGIRMTAIGIAIGLAMALPLPKVFDAMFNGLHAREPRLYFIVPLAVLLVTALATYIPARRALSVDPVMALRHE